MIYASFFLRIYLDYTSKTHHWSTWPVIYTVVTKDLLYLHLPNGCHGDKSPPESLKHTVRK